MPTASTRSDTAGRHELSTPCRLALRVSVRLIGSVSPGVFPQSLASAPPARSRHPIDRRVSKIRLLYSICALRRWVARTRTDQTLCPENGRWRLPSRATSASLERGNGTRPAVLPAGHPALTRIDLPPSPVLRRLGNVSTLQEAVSSRHMQGRIDPAVAARPRASSAIAGILRSIHNRAAATLPVRIRTSEITRLTVLPVSRSVRVEFA